MINVHDIPAYLRRVVTQPTTELSRAQRRIRYMFDLVRHCERELRQDRAAQMAAALTYRTIFSLIPVAVMSMIVFRAFATLEGSREQLLEQAYAFFNLDQASVVATDQAMQTRIDQTITDLITQAWNINFRGLGGIGLLVLIWAGLALLVTVEQSFNTVYKTPRGRPWHRRIPIYWAALTLGPVLLFVSIYLAEYFVSTLTGMLGVGSLWAWFGGLPAVGASWLLLLLMYMLMPNTAVRIQPAAVGALVAAVLWEVGKWGFKLYVTHASYTSIYGAIGLIPLFLLWLYVTWWIVLFGLELSYTLQAMAGREFDKRAQANDNRLIDSQWVIPILTAVGRRFADGGTTTSRDLASTLDLPPRAVDRLTVRLIDAGLLHRVMWGDDDGDAGLTLAKPPTRINLADLVDLCRRLAMGDAGDAGDAARADSRVLDVLTEAQRKAVAGQTLADLVNGEAGDVVDAVDASDEADEAHAGGVDRG